MGTAVFGAAASAVVEEFMGSAPVLSEIGVKF
jgi:hypothetical protein